MFAGKLEIQLRYDNEGFIYETDSSARFHYFLSLFEAHILYGGDI